jgi:transposase-like protein
MGHDGALVPTGSAGVAAQDSDGTEIVVWRYPDMCRHWGVSRTTVERWVRRFEEAGEGIPVHRDPSGRPYWLAHEAAADVGRYRPSDQRTFADERLGRLRRAASRGRQRS